MTPSVEIIGAFEAKTHLSRLLRETESGRVFHITHRGRVVAELRPPAPAAPAAARGDLRGKIEMGDDFFAPLDDFREYT